MSWERIASWTLGGPVGGLLYENQRKKSDKKEAAAANSAAAAANAQVAATAAAADKEADRKGRLALISTSPEGLFGSSTTGRNKVFGG